ncbi:TraB/GumN family protein [Candidatus Woesearchaeota archaeon]|nr:TraB/GumN family protein [Candidatus Woesearchaeota archaeon]MBW3017057.1 TraB/GumN family protein [Candidatus Woesearchaeota archaeon]
MQVDNLSILGTSHIARQSLEEVRARIESFKPDIVALELDKRRLIALLSKKKPKPSLRDIKYVGLKGFMFNLFGAYIEKKLGKMVGVKPGSEMKLAYLIAREKHLKIALIDQKIEITLRNFSKSFTWKERFRFGWDIIKSAITRKPQIQFDLSSVPNEELIERMVSVVKQRYPSFYKVLVEDRNNVMATNLAHLIKTFQGQRIVAVVGAGHEKELADLVKQKLYIHSNDKIIK